MERAIRILYTITILAALFGSLSSCSSNEPLYHFTFGGTDFRFHDVSPTSLTVKTVLNEIKNGEYGLDSIQFQRGDIVLDVGANVGIVSIILGKLNPGITIYAFEPVPLTYKTLLKNLKMNGVTNVVAVNRALSGDVAPLTINADYEVNPGGSSSFVGDAPGAKRLQPVTVQSMTLDDVFRHYGIASCKLLKIDCEGCEYDVLYSTGMLDRISGIAGEFHNYPTLAAKGKTSAALQRYIRRKNPGITMNVVTYTHGR